MTEAEEERGNRNLSLLWLLVFVRKIFPLILFALKKNKVKYIQIMTTKKSEREREGIASNCFNTRVRLKIKQKQTLRVFNQNKTQEQQPLACD